MTKESFKRISQSKIGGNIARLAIIAGAFTSAMVLIPAPANATDCPFEIIRGCRCPADCNSDSCETTCVVVGQSRSGGCAYQCQACSCSGIACNPGSGWPFTFVGFAVKANAAESQPKLAPNKTIEVHNADGDFVIVPKEEIENLKSQTAGIGISVVKSSSGTATVGSVVGDSPAGSAGLAAGDEIVSIDGRKTEGLPLTTVTQWLRGRSATLVVLKVKGKDGKSRKVPLNRVELSTVGTAAKKKPDVTIKNLTLKDLKSTICPAESNGCHLLSQDGEDCMYSCKKND